jgi:hypothetical protein
VPCFAVHRGIRGSNWTKHTDSFITEKQKNTGELEAVRINEGRKEEFKKELQEEINEEGKEGEKNAIFNTMNLIYCAHYSVLNRFWKKKKKTVTNSGGM